MSTASPFGFEPSTPGNVLSHVPVSYDADTNSSVTVPVSFWESSPTTTSALSSGTTVWSTTAPESGTNGSARNTSTPLVVLNATDSICLRLLYQDVGSSRYIAYLIMMSDMDNWCGASVENNAIQSLLTINFLLLLALGRGFSRVVSQAYILCEYLWCYMKQTMSDTLSQDIGVSRLQSPSPTMCDITITHSHKPHCLTSQAFAKVGPNPIAFRAWHITRSSCGNALPGCEPPVTVTIIFVVVGITDIITLQKNCLL